VTEGFLEQAVEHAGEGSRRRRRWQARAEFTGNSRDGGADRDRMARDMRITRRQFLQRSAFLAGGVAAADGFAIEPRRLRVVSLDRRDLGLGLTLVHFSDIHHAGDRGYFERVVRLINGLRPDFALFTGDMVNGVRSDHLAEAMEICAGIRVPVYGVAGNHDPWSPDCLGLFREGFAATGGKWLLNETTDLGGCLLQACTHWQGVPAAPPADPKRKRILLCHYPAVADHAVERPYDLILSGHSHGGQVRFPWFGALYLPPGTGRYVLGEYDAPLGRLFVSAGVGTTGLRLRFLCPPDIAVIRT
jgi:predicted MPP superfamily phosphohydrolase